MPYITQKIRNELDPSIKLIIEGLHKENWNTGHVNYVFTRIVWEWFKRRKRYDTINAIRGVLGCVWTEFCRRKYAPYEDSAIAKNGDILGNW